MMYHRPKDPNTFLLEVLATLKMAKLGETPVRKHYRCSTRAVMVVEDVYSLVSLPICVDALQSPFFAFDSFSVAIRILVHRSAAPARIVGARSIFSLSGTLTT